MRLNTEIFIMVQCSLEYKVGILAYIFRITLRNQIHNRPTHYDYNDICFKLTIGLPKSSLISVKSLTKMLQEWRLILFPLSCMKLDAHTLSTE